MADFSVPAVLQMAQETCVLLGEVVKRNAPGNRLPVLGRTRWEADALHVLERLEALSGIALSVPAGYRLVPVEPTSAMLLAANNELAQGNGLASVLSAAILASQGEPPAKLQRQG
jgi:hypothetical protein